MHAYILYIHIYILYISVSCFSYGTTDCFLQLGHKHCVQYIIIFTCDECISNLSFYCTSPVHSDNILFYHRVPHRQLSKHTEYSEDAHCMFWSETMQLSCHGTSNRRLKPSASDADRRVQRRHTAEPQCVRSVRGAVSHTSRAVMTLTVVFIITAGPQTHRWLKAHIQPETHNRKTSYISMEGSG